MLTYWSKPKPSSLSIKDYKSDNLGMSCGDSRWQNIIKIWPFSMEDYNLILYNRVAWRQPIGWHVETRAHFPGILNPKWIIPVSLNLWRVLLPWFCPPGHYAGQRKRGQSRSQCQVNVLNHHEELRIEVHANMALQRWWLLCLGNYQTNIHP